MLSVPLDEKLKALAATLEAEKNIAIAFSGGLDSRFLSHAAALRPSGTAGVRLFHIRGPHVSEKESAYAVNWAKERGFALQELDVDPLALPEVRNNAPERCYFCKRELFTTLAKAAGENCIICDGTNADDLGEYRPGLKALRELGIKSPLAESGLSKGDIRKAGAQLGMDDPEQAARPCLLTRFAYGLEASENTLQKLAAAESAIARLLGFWTKENGRADIPDFRLRILPPGLSIQPFKTELHLAEALPQAWLDRLEEAVVRTGFPAPETKILEKVGGYHDRESNAS